MNNNSVNSIFRIKEQQNQLEKQRQTLAYALEQLAIHGPAYAPPSLMYTISESRLEIARIKSNLRNWGVWIEDHPDDGEREKPASSPFSANRNRINMIRRVRWHWIDGVLKRSLTTVQNVCAELRTKKGTYQIW